MSQQQLTRTFRAKRFDPDRNLEIFVQSHAAYLKTIDPALSQAEYIGFSIEPDEFNSLSIEQNLTVIISYEPR